MADLFSSGGRADLGGGNQRPLLCVLDRDLDLVTMLHHTWTYQAMAHDILGMRHNKITVPVQPISEESGAPPKPLFCALDENDAFWTSHANDAFPDVAQAVEAEVTEYTTKTAGMGGGPQGEPSSASDLTAAMGALPGMAEKKRSIDTHTNIATALLHEIQARDLAHYYELEDLFRTQSLNTSIGQIEALYEGVGKGTLSDKTRAMMVLYLLKPHMTVEQQKTLTDMLESKGGSSAGMQYLQHLMTIRNLTSPTAAPPPAPAPPASGSLLAAGTSLLGGLADTAMNQSMSLLSAGVDTMRNIIVSKEELVVCRVMDDLMENMPTDTENFLYIDPKAAHGVEVPRMRAPFQKAIVFMIGGGNYAELQALQEAGQKHRWSVVYGATDMVTPEHFLDGLNQLGGGKVADDIR